ncbi:universal stress protein, partial [Chloroflexota bacterium]
SVPSATGSITGPALKQQIEAQQQKAQGYLAKIAAQVADEGADSRYEAIMGAPGHSIVEYARENKMELIAIATHGHSGIKRAVLGSVADYVIRESRLPILVIKPK